MEPWRKSVQARTVSPTSSPDELWALMTHMGPSFTCRRFGAARIEIADNMSAVLDPNTNNPKIYCEDGSIHCARRCCVFVCSQWQPLAMGEQV